MKYLFNNIKIVTMDDNCPVIDNGYLGVDGGKICYIGSLPPSESADTVIDGNNKVIMPGLVNAHTHLSMTLFRSYADDMVLQDWLFNKIFPAEAKLDTGLKTLGAELAAAELTAAGVTCSADMYSGVCGVASAMYKSGLKCNISLGTTGSHSSYEDFLKSRDASEIYELLRDWNGKGNGQILADFSIHAEYTSDKGLWESAARFAKENKMGMHIHMSETQREHNECIKKYGKTPAEVFCESGVFDVPCYAAHCVAVSDSDIDIMREKHVSAVHNPISNLKLASGIARTKYMTDNGVNVALGTDGTASNNNLDMFEEIKAAALLSKGISGDPVSITAYEALKMATVNGAKALHRENQCGCLKVGYDADIIMLDLDKPHLTPCFDIASILCYSAKGSDVVMTMCQGNILYQNGKYNNLDIERILSEVRRKVLIF